MNRHQIFNALVVMLLITSMSIATVPGALAQSSGSENASPPEWAEAHGLDADLPDPAQERAFADMSVRADNNADTMGATVTTPERAAASEYTGVDTRGSGYALVLEDDRAHDARDVAVPVDFFDEADQDVPEQVIGTHSSGDVWVDDVTVEDDYVTFEVPMFSSNTVTFSGEVSIEADPAEDGSTFEYDVNDPDSIDDFDIDITGVENTEDITSSETLASGESFTVDVGGNKAPRSDTVTLSGVSEASTSWSYTGHDDIPNTVGTDGDIVVTGSSDEEVHGLDTDGNQQWAYTGHGHWIWDLDLESDTVYTAGLDEEVHAIDASDGSQIWSYTGHSDDVRGVASDGDSVYSAGSDDTVRSLDASDGSHQWTYDEGQDFWAVTTDGDTIYAGDSNGVLHAIDTDGSQIWTYDGQPERIASIAVDSGAVYTGSYDGDSSGELHAVDKSDGSPEWTYTSYTEDADIWGLDTNGESVFSGTTTSELRSVDASDGSLSWIYDDHSDTVGGVAVDDDGALYTASQDGSARQLFIGVSDPQVDIDGNAVSYSGDLSGDETHTESVTLSTGSHSASATTSQGDVAVDVERTEVTVTEDPTIKVNGNEASYDGVLSDGETTQLSTDSQWIDSGTNTVDVSMTAPDGPTAQVGLNYEHQADKLVSTDYESEHWQESYEVSHTFQDAHDNARISIPFIATVHNVHSAEVSINDGGWTELDSSDISLDGNTAHLDLRNVDEGDEVAVRATGHKVDVRDGELSVTQATNIDEELNSEIYIEEVGDDFRIGIGATEYADRVHYLDDANYDADEYTEHHASSAQQMFLPGAEAGSSATVTASALGIHEVDSTTQITVTDEGDETVGFEVLEGTGTVAFHDTTSDETYALYDDGDAIEVDTASSPVYFSISSGTYSIGHHDSDSGSSSSSGGGTGPIDRTSDAIPDIIILGIGIGIISLLYVLQRRFWSHDNERRFIGVLPANPVFLLGTGLTTFALVELLSGGAITAAIADGLEEILPLLGLMFGGIVAYGFYRYIIRGTETEVVIDGGDT